MNRFYTAQLAIIFSTFILFSNQLKAETEDIPVPTANNPISNELESIVKEIEFRGLSLYKPKTLLKKLKTKENKILNSQTLKEDVKILFETGYFDDVEVAVKSLEEKDKKGRPLSIIEFTVEERYLIKRIDYKGNKKIKPGEFAEKIQSEEGAPFDKFKASLDARAILEHYRGEGYANADVEHYTSVDQKKKKMILTFFITEGERVIVRTIQIEGNESFKEKKILKQMETRRKKVYKSEILLFDDKKIANFYKNHGHLDVVVSTPQIVIDQEKNHAHIKFQITEGPKYTVGDVTFDGATIFSQKELKKAVILKKKELYRQKKLEETVGNISSMYADKGYLRTQVDAIPERIPETGQVNFDIQINESSVVYVDGVYVDGNTYTKEYVISREILLNKGDIFSAGKMRRSVEKIYNLGFLDDVQVDVQQPRSPDLADLIFTVKEGKPGVLSAGAGFSSVDRFVGTLQVQHSNLFGKAQRADLSYEFGGRRQSFDIRWTDPWFLGYRMTGGVDLFNTVRRRDFAGNRNSFRESRRGGAIRLGPRISDRLGLVFTYTAQNTKVFDVDSGIKEDLFPTFGIPEDDALNTSSVNQFKSSFISEIFHDTRDNRFDATRGSRNSLALELAGGPFGGDSNFYKPQVTTAWYFPTFWKFVFSISGRAAWANKFSPSFDVPSSERFFLGGADTVRGYDQNSIVPREFEPNEEGIESVSRVPGRILALFNAEYKFPIVQEKNRTIFQGAFFLDVGGTWLETSDIDLTTGSLDRRMKAGVGFGFRFKTPVFPIRLDFGYPLNPRDTDNTRQGDSHSLQPYFTIGNIF